MTTSSPARADAARARFSDFYRLAELAAEGGGFVWLEGAEENHAGLTPEQMKACGARFDSDACAISFCVNGITFTAVEDGDDGYRSAMGGLFERPGNHCKNRFGPVPLTLSLLLSPQSFSEAPAKCDAPAEADMAALRHAGVKDDILCAGTDYSDDYYPTFISHFSREALTRAVALFEAGEIERVSRLEAGLDAPSAHRL